MAYKKTKVTPITEDTQKKNAQLWLSVVRYGESGVVVQIQDDCEFRIPEVINNLAFRSAYLGKFHKKYLLISVPVDGNDVFVLMYQALMKVVEKQKISISAETKLSDVESLIQEVTKKGFDIGFFLFRSNKLLSEELFSSMHRLEELLEKVHNCSILLFFDQDPLGKQHTELLDKCSLLFDHILFYPLYNQADVIQFIMYQNSMWNMHLTTGQKNEIMHWCGGYLWLISHLQRILRTNCELKIDQMISDVAFLNKVGVIWNKFNSAEKQLLTRIYHHSVGETDTGSYEYQRLTKLGVIQASDKVALLSVPAFGLIIEQNERLCTWQLSENSIVVNDVDISQHLSKNEHILLLQLLQNRSHIVSRDAIAKAIWGEDWEDKYSDWAIDRLLYRLRKTLNSLQLDSSLIQTIKKKGVKFG